MSYRKHYHCFFLFPSYVYTCGCVYMYSGKCTILCVKVQQNGRQSESMSVSSLLAVFLNNLKTWSSQVSLTSQHLLGIFISHHSHWSCQTPSQQHLGILMFQHSQSHRYILPCMTFYVSTEDRNSDLDNCSAIFLVFFSQFYTGDF